MTHRVIEARECTENGDMGVAIVYVREKYRHQSQHPVFGAIATDSRQSKTLEYFIL